MHGLSRIGSVVILAMFTLAVWLGGPVGCLGQQARDNVAVPTLSTAVDDVVADARSGVDNLAEAERAEATKSIDAFAAAIASSNRTTIAATAWPAWPLVRKSAEAGIAADVAAGTLGPDAAPSLIERLDRFEELLAKTVAFSP